MTLKVSDNPPAFFPEDLFEGSPSTDGNVWWVARTKSRQEKAMAWELHAKGLPYYLPLVAKPQNCRGRMRASILPLFSGYLFFKSDWQGRYDALRCGRIAQILEVQDQEKITRELANLNLATQARVNLTLCDFAKEGQRVRIIAGPFSGLEGIVRKQKNQTRLVLNLEAIRQAATVEIALDQAQPI
ncbi:MAG: transcription termination/antitermination NusG family protein [Thermodesulfobacteriota bacterium]